MIYFIGVIYSILFEQMKVILMMVQVVIDVQVYSIFNCCYFIEFVDLSLNFELVYYIDICDFMVVLNEQ